VLVWRAAGRLGVGVQAAADTDGLLAIGARVTFRHPLVRSSVYRAASPEDRQAVHRALSGATDPAVDPDRRAWHLAQATPGLGIALITSGPGQTSAKRSEQQAGPGPISIAGTMKREHRVAVVVDPALSRTVEQLARDLHAWAVRSPDTEGIARRIWRDQQPDSEDVLDAGLTLFNGESSPERSLLSILDTVELHHGEYSHDPPLAVIHVLGVHPTDAICNALAELGVTEITAADHGFIARRGA
jgi:hypothetical protein